MARCAGPYYAELGIEPDPVATAAARASFDANACELLEQFRPSVVSFHFGLPAPELLARVRGWGATMLPQVVRAVEVPVIAAGGEALGSADYSPLWAGQNVSGCCGMPGRW